MCLWLSRHHQITQGAPPPPLSCKDQGEMFHLFTFMQGVCISQLNEAPRPFGGPYPMTCRSADCARAIHRISVACEHLLTVTPFLGGYKAQLRALTTLCAKQAVLPSPLFSLTNSSLASTVRPVCQGEIIDRGWNQSISSVQRFDLTILAPPGHRTRLHFATLWLPKGVSLHIFDGDSSSSRELVALSGTTLPSQDLTATKGAIHMQLLVDAPDSYTMPMALGSKIECTCVDDRGCAPHGLCDRASGRCACSGGYIGPTCSDSSCIGVDCGPHGNCTRGGKCICDDQYRQGPDRRCTVRIGPCTNTPPHVTLGDDNSWRKITSPGGTHCDASNPGWGSKGPYTPLGNKWFRFIGQAGNAMPTKPVHSALGHAACGTAATGACGYNRPCAH